MYKEYNSELDMSSQADELEKWRSFLYRATFNTIAYPIEYAKVLIQLGYEPISPWPTTSLFGQPALALPNVFQYVKYIKRVDGFTGCYRGLIPKLCAGTISAVVSDRTSKYLEEVSKGRNNRNDLLGEAHFPTRTSERNNDYYNELDEDEEDRETFNLDKLISELVSRVVGIIVSHPLDVITLRMMAQFVGRETKYNGLFRSFGEVYRENGLMGYYAGLVPRLIGNAAVIILVSTSTYLINKYLISDSEIKTYTASTMRFIATTVTYPFLVVSHCMAVNNCGLTAGLPPHMPIYNSWMDCWSNLRSYNQLSRGNSLIWRYYTGPQILINGKPQPVYANHFRPSKTE